MTENTVSQGRALLSGEKLDVVDEVPARTDSELPATRESELFMSPAVDIYETEDGLTVLADVPGVDKNDVEIHVDDKILTIRGTVSLPKRRGMVSEEFGMLNYFRQFRLSDEVDQGKIKASIDQGVLTLRLPKAERAKPRRIEVRTS